jgi:hypothetical protein
LSDDGSGEVRGEKSECRSTLRNAELGMLNAEIKSL